MYRKARVWLIENEWANAKQIHPMQKLWGIFFTGQRIGGKLPGRLQVAHCQSGNRNCKKAGHTPFICIWSVATESNGCNSNNMALEAQNIYSLSLGRKCLPTSTMGIKTDSLISIPLTSFFIEEFGRNLEAFLPEGLIYFSLLQWLSSPKWLLPTHSSFLNAGRGEYLG